MYLRNTFGDIFKNFPFWRIKNDTLKIQFAFSESNQGSLFVQGSIDDH